jgi:hypothetical protein
LPNSEAQLVQAIDTLVASGLAFRRGVPPDSVYTDDFGELLLQCVGNQCVQVMALPA